MLVLSIFLDPTSSWLYLLHLNKSRIEQFFFIFFVRLFFPCVFERQVVDVAQSMIIFYYCCSFRFKLQTICSCISMCEFSRSVEKKKKKHQKPKRKVLLWWHFKRRNTFTRMRVWVWAHFILRPMRTNICICTVRSICDH